MKLSDILRAGREREASDVHIKVGSPPLFRIFGDLERSDMDPVGTSDTEVILEEMELPELSLEKLQRFRQVDVGYGLPGVGRFRVNIFYQRGSLAFAFRFIPFEIPTIEELHLPPVIGKLAMKERGLVLITGVTGSGKTTTFASMVNIINNSKKKYIITIEDPIEYLHQDKKSAVVQRQVGFDVMSFSDGLRGALREDPDVILVGEMRDRETMRVALEAVETGHLVFSTLHTLNAVETVNRIISAFPMEEQSQIRHQLAGVLEAIISQRLIRKSDGRGMVPAVEIMIATEFVRDAIVDPEKTRNIMHSIEMNRKVYGTQSFDQSLLDLYSQGFITLDDALKYATNPGDLKLKIRGIT